jgi:hypothetical protein
LYSIEKPGGQIWPPGPAENLSNGHQQYQYSKTEIGIVFSATGRSKGLGLRP